MIEIYKGVLLGNTTLADAKLKNQLDLQGQEVFVTPEAVEAMLNKFLDDEMNAQQLSHWADFLISNDVYVTEGWEDDTQSDKFEPMWEILQELSTPFIDGPITKNRVKNYITQLSRIN